MHLFIVNHINPKFHPSHGRLLGPTLIQGSIFWSYLSVLYVGCQSLTDCLLLWPLHCCYCFEYYNYGAVNVIGSSTISVQMVKNSVESCTAATFYFILHILPNICNPYIIPEAEIPENWTVVFRRRPHRDTDRLERQSRENFHGEECPRGRGSEAALEVGCWRPHQNMQLGSFQSWELPTAK